MLRKKPSLLSAGGVLAATIFACLSAASAAVPPLVNFQGVIRNTDGSTPSDGVYSITFSLWDDLLAGSLLWTETQNASVLGGVMSAPLGATVPLDDVLHPELGAQSSLQYYLEIQVGIDPPMEPRIPIVSVPYSVVTSGVSGDVETWPGGMRVESTTPGLKYVDILTADSGGMYIIDKSSPLLHKALSVGIRESPTMAQGMEAKEELLSGDTAGVFVGIRESPTRAEIEVAVDDSGAGLLAKDKSSPKLMFVGIRESPTLLGKSTTLGMKVTDNNVPAKSAFVGIRESPTMTAMHMEEVSLSGDTSNVFVGIRESPVAGTIECAVDDSGSGLLLKVIDKSSPGLFKTKAEMYCETDGGGMKVIRESPTEASSFFDLFVSDTGGVHVQAKDKEPIGPGFDLLSYGGRSSLMLQRRWAQQAESFFDVFADTAQAGLSLQIRESPTEISSFFDLFVADTNGRLILGSGSSHGRPDRRIVTYADSNQTRFSMGEINPFVTDFKEYVVYAAGPDGGSMAMMDATGDTCVSLSGHKGWIDIPTGTPPPPSASYDRLRLALEAGGLIMTGQTASDTRDTLLCVTPDDPAKLLNTNTGAYLSQGGVWTNTSDASLKENFQPVETVELLEKISALPIMRWNYRSEPNAVQHIGPTAQDFHALFGVGADDRTISTIDPAGIALAAIQLLYAKTKEIDELRAEVARLQQTVGALSTQQRDGGR
jgi:hypothetical protein